MALNIGDTLGDYQIIGILGAGGMGKVYKVRNVISDRVEAIKVLLPDLANEAELGDRFIREIRLLASLDHPNIAALHTALRLDNQLLMIMEFVEGTTLEARLQQQGPLPPGEAIDYIAQVVSALGYAHERGVVHRDIKPANMMVTAGGTVKLMDFGIAKAKADRRLTMTGTTMGSLYYMSPEQVKGAADIDGRSDIYSVGVSLYELVTGKRPFRGDSDYAIMVAHLEQDPVPPIQVDPRLPPALNEIIMTAIQKDPANRFQTARAFRGALDSVKGSMAGPALGPQPAGVPREPVQPAAGPAAVPAPQPAAGRSHRGLYMALGAVAALAVLAVAAIQVPRWYKIRAGTNPPAAVESQPPAQTPAPVETQAPAETQPPAQTQAPVQSAPESAAAPAVPPPAPAVASSQEALSPSTPVRPASGAARRVAAPQRQEPPAPAAVEQPVAQPVQSPPPARAEPAPAAPAADNRTALQPLRERMVLLAARANALRSSLENLERQQKAMGLGLRGDVSASWKRMEFLMDEAENALKTGDPGSLKRNLDMAEREVDKLDQFLGR